MNTKAPPEPEALCLWCHAPVRKAVVLAGPLPGRRVKLWIDVDPHPAGVVLLRDDGQLREVRSARRVRPNRQAFRVHSSRSCGGEQVQ